MMEEDTKEQSSVQEKINAASRDEQTKLPLNPTEFTILKEGEAEILLHGNDVFYNKAQVVNRDLSIAVLRAFAKKRKEQQWNKSGRQISNEVTGNWETEVSSAAKEPTKSAVHCQDYTLEGDNKVPSGQVKATCGSRPTAPLRVLEALAASGLRALRYAREVEEVRSVVALDNDKVAIEYCKRNIKLNGSVAASKVQAVLADSRIYMLTHEREFDVVDIDPYGSPSAFLDSAVQTIADGGILMCTATDMGVLCGNNGEVCYSKYGAYSLRAKYCHEMALRILLASIESHANRYKRYIVPVLSVSIDFYIRVFVQIFTSASMVKSTPSKLSYVYQCVGCDCFHLQPVGRVVYKNNSMPRYLPGIGPLVLPECKHCHKHFSMGGPMWSNPIHDPDWIKLILKDVSTFGHKYPACHKVQGVMTAISEELVDVPLYVNLHSLVSTLKCTSPSANLFRFAIANAGYRVSGAHSCALGLKTDAPMDVIWDILRCWVKTHPVKAQPEDSPGSIILSQRPAFEANFSKVSSALSKAKLKGVPRFVPNTESYWGPKLRAGRKVTGKHVSSLGIEVLEGLSRHEVVAIKEDLEAELDTETDDKHQVTQQYEAVEVKEPGIKVDPEKEEEAETKCGNEAVAVKELEIKVKSEIEGEPETKRQRLVDESGD